MCAEDGATGLQGMGVGGNHFFRLLWVQIGKGNKSKHAFCVKGPKCSYTSCLFFAGAVPNLAQAEFGSRSGVSAPLALSPYPLPPSLSVGVSSLTTDKVNLLLPPTVQGRLTMTPLTTRRELGMGSLFPFLFPFNH